MGKTLGCSEAPVGRLLARRVNKSASDRLCDQTGESGCQDGGADAGSGVADLICH